MIQGHREEGRRKTMGEEGREEKKIEGGHRPV